MPSLAFYLKKPLVVVDSHSNELFLGNPLRDSDIVISADQFKQRLQGRPTAIVVVDQQIKTFGESDFFHHFKLAKQIGKTSLYVN